MGVSKTSFKAGQKRPHQGRPKGSPNKVTMTTREMIQDIINQHLPKVMDDLRKLTPGQRVKAIADLLQYVVPKMQASTSDVNINATKEQIRALFPTADELIEADK